MKIDFKNEREKVCMAITFNIPYIGNYIYKFESTVNSLQEAAFVRDAITQQFGNTIERIQREAYEEGYKTGRAKRRKETWFRRHFNNL